MLREIERGGGGRERLAVRGTLEEEIEKTNLRAA
jgi:hypothetical protein